MCFTETFELFHGIGLGMIIADAEGWFCVLSVGSKACGEQEREREREGGFHGPSLDEPGIRNNPANTRSDQGP